jgi:hypothetical protein
MRGSIDPRRVASGQWSVGPCSGTAAARPGAESAEPHGALVTHVHALAAIIWHEMAHIAGADEAEAQDHEEKLWTRFVRDKLVDRV